MTKLKNQIHFTLQGKGGVGKSLCSAIQTQYFISKGAQVQAFDTDPVNDTLAQYSELKAQTVPILEKDQTINTRAFDKLMEQLLASDGVSIVDNGASTFVPLMAYMAENNVSQFFKDANKTLYIHSVITGGQAFDDTTLGLQQMLDQHNGPVVVWKNEFFGEVSKNSKLFEESELYLGAKQSIAGLVTLKRRNPDTFGKDMELMVKHKMTFDQAIASDEFAIMAKQRIKMMKADVFEQLDAIAF
jgi:hypothetical protein